MKLNRANELFLAMLSRVETWNASRSFMAPLRVSADRAYIEFLAPVGSRPPVDEWALLFGDAIHNTRSALDGIVWEFAHLGGSAPSNPNALSFPVVEDHKKWRGAVDRKLPNVPDDLVERIRAAQPFVVPNVDNSISWLKAVSRLDNDDKHRGMIIAVPIIERLSIEGLNLHLGAAPDGLEASFRVEYQFDEVPDGEPFARLSFGKLIAESSSIPEVAHVIFKASVRYDGKLIPPELFRSEALPYINGLLSFLRTGTWPDDENITNVEPTRFEPRPADEPRADNAPSSPIAVPLADADHSVLVEVDTLPMRDARVG
jgi:hypothetical protein